MPSKKRNRTYDDLPRVPPLPPPPLPEAHGLPREFRQLLSPGLLADRTTIDQAFQLIDELQPSTALENMLVAHIAATFGRYHRISQQADAYDASDLAWSRALTNAERSWHRAMGEWQRHRRTTIAEQRLVLAQQKAEIALQKAEVARQKAAEEEATNAPFVMPVDDTDPDAPIDWREYIAIDPAIDPEYPVIKGTKIEAELVAACLAENYPLDAIFEFNRGLTYQQIRAILACEAEHMCGPWPNGVPTPKLHPAPRGKRPPYHEQNPTWTFRMKEDMRRAEATENPTEENPA
jgi:uncharacterized protein (DUF433 family)